MCILKQVMVYLFFVKVDIHETQRQEKIRSSVEIDNAVIVIGCFLRLVEYTTKHIPVAEALSLRSITIVCFPSNKYNW